MEEITMTTATTPETTAADQKPKNWSDKLGDVLATAYIVMHFVPIATSICWLIYFISGQNDDLMYILAPIMLVGMVSALLTHPIRIIGFALKRVGMGFWTPLVSVPFFPANLVASALCGGIMATLCLGLILFAPAVLPLYFFFEE